MLSKALKRLRKPREKLWILNRLRKNTSRPPRRRRKCNLLKNPKLTWKLMKKSKKLRKKPRKKLNKQKRKLKRKLMPPTLR